MYSPERHDTYVRYGDPDVGGRAPPPQGATCSSVSAEDDLVLANGVGRTLGYTRLRKAFNTARDAATIQDATPHTCRHTFASILIDQGRDVEFVSKQLGHASTKTTWDTYVHLFKARENAEAARRDLDAAFGRMLRAADQDPSGWHSSPGTK